MSVSAYSDFLRHFEAAKPSLRAFIASVVQDPCAREDVLQATALTLWQKWAHYDATRPFGAWARGIAAHKILHERRGRARFPVTLEPSAIEALRLAFDRQENGPLNEDDRAAALRHCLSRLPEKSRELLFLRYEENRSCLTIASVLGRSAEAIYQHLSRLRVHLAECIRRRLSSDR